MNRNQTTRGSGSALVLAVLLGILFSGQVPPASGEQQWFRGQLHAHTYWSDGRGFPEQAAEAYKQRGYQFLSISDHNRFAEDTNVWRVVAANEGSWPPKVSQSIFDAYCQSFGKDWVESITTGAVTSVRLRTYAEVKAKFEEPGIFMMLPGVELTQKVKDLGLHLNYVNLPRVLPCIKGPDLIKTVKGTTTLGALLALNAAETAQAANDASKPVMLTLNHPFWVYYDVAASNLVDHPEIRFFEVCNGGSSYAPHPKAPNYTVEMFWDAVNAFRRSAGQPLLFGIGTDDAHFYDPKRIHGENGVGDAWVMVRAEELAPEPLLAALHHGDFYASSGVLLEEAAFTAADNTLRVKVKAEPGAAYKIHFIVTKRNFDQTVNVVSWPAEKGRLARSVPVYSDDIGRTVKTVEGIESSYRLEPDDLYVRARVESDSPGTITPHFHPKVKTAWTQPYCGND